MNLAKRATVTSKRSMEKAFTRTSCAGFSSGRSPPPMVNRPAGMLMGTVDAATTGATDAGAGGLALARDDGGGGVWDAAISRTAKVDIIAINHTQRGPRSLNARRPRGPC